MTTALVRFALPERLDLPAVRRGFAEVAPAFRRPDGLLRKYFLLAEDGRSAGGVYLWKSRDAAERFYAGGFREMIAEKYGSLPTIAYFETPIVVDNVAGEVVGASESVD